MPVTPSNTRSATTLQVNEAELQVSTADESEEFDILLNLGDATVYMSCTNCGKKFDAPVISFAENATAMCLIGCE